MNIQSTEVKALLNIYSLDDIQKMYQADAFDEETKATLRPYLKERIFQHLLHVNTR